MVPQMDERQVFLNHWVERNYWRLDVLRVDQVPVSAHVSGGVHQLFHLREKSLIFGGKFLPGGFEPGNGTVTQSRDNSEHRTLFTANILFSVIFLIHINHIKSKASSSVLATCKLFSMNNSFNSFICFR